MLCDIHNVSHKKSFIEKRRIQMKRIICVIFIMVIASIGLSQTFTMVKNDAISGKSGLGIGFDTSNQKVIRSSFGNPPVIDYLHKDTLVVEGTLATGSATYGTLAGFGMGVGPDGSVVILDHIESPEPDNGLIRWTGISDTNPGLCTAAPSVPFPRYITILGTGTDQVFICAGAISGVNIGPPINVLTTSDGNTWSIAYSVGDQTLTPPEYGGQRGSAAYVGNGTNEFPQYIFGCDAYYAYSGEGIHYHERVGVTYVYRGDMNPTSTDSNPAILSIAIDPGIAPTESADGEVPVLIALGHHDSADHKTALYMFNLQTKQEITVLPFTPASAEIGWYGAIGLDTENNRVYFSMRNGGDSTLGYADYTVPVWHFVTAASNWTLYE